LTILFLSISFKILLHYAAGLNYRTHSEILKKP
jgi:hypothetical protein